MRTRPDFIAYRFSDRDNLSLRLCRSLYGVQEASWTIRSKADMDAVEAAGEFRSTLAKVVEFKDNLTALMDLEARGVDAVAMDLLVANDNIARAGKAYRILEERLAPEEYGVGFRKGDQALRDAVQAQLSAMAHDGSLAEIATRWFGADITIVK